jgi:hypothetical protein
MLKRIARTLAPLLAACALGAGFGGCNARPRSSVITIQESTLYGDLGADHHDALFCALSYLTGNGGPALVGSPSDAAALRTNRGPMTAWLLAQPNRDQLAAGYSAFKQSWNPVYPD